MAQTASSSARRSVTGFCRELALPPADLSHHAGLVNVFAMAQGQQTAPACIAVSPEGEEEA